VSEQFVLDASMALAWCFEDEGGSYALEVLDRLATGEAVAPSLWRLEVADALVHAERRGRLTQAESTRFLDLLRQLPIRIEETPLQRAWSDIVSLARSVHLSTYDAVYLDLAMRLGLPLATLDDALRQAAAQRHVRLV
jgi:predicted nucleic acid-binding protein